MHRPEGVVKVGLHHPVVHHFLAQQFLQQLSHEGDRFSRIGNLPAHHHHEAEPEQKKQQPGETVLDADDLVVRGENIFAPKAQLLVRRLVALEMSNLFLFRCWLHDFAFRIPCRQKPGYPRGQLIEGRKLTFALIQCQRRMPGHLTLSHTINRSNSGRYTIDA